MNVLLIGSGGREHALAWKLSQSSGLTKLFAAPGNPGIAKHAALAALDPADHGAVIAFCREAGVELVVIGPEAPLVEGLGDSLRAAGLLVFGPDRAAAQLEGSKGFTKRLCAANDIPTAGHVEARDLATARSALAPFGLPVVIKADGLAAGKGVTIAYSAEEAEAALAQIFENDSGAAVVIEEFMDGEEASFFALTDGATVLPFGSAQDHKRVGEGDTGPNTGGMGAYSPAAVFTPELQARAITEIVAPTVRALAASRAPYSGILYAGLMLTAEGPKLVEYNVRFGDPECQVLMLRLESDLLALMLATAQGRLAEVEAPRFSSDAALTVVMAASGYPGTPAKGAPIDGLNDAEAEGAVVFQAGTIERGGVLVANGGRVLDVTALGAGVREAQRTAYAAVNRIRFPGGFFRRDIGWRALARERG